MSMKNFRAEDMPVKIAIADDSRSKKEQAQVRVQDQVQGQSKQTTQSSNEPPDGTSAEVLEWVGDDKKRAQAALDKEQANEKPRVGLTSDLQDILDEEDDK